jgi:hypothetical protein
MLKVSYHAVKGVEPPMLPWIHSTRHVHHRSSLEYLRVVSTRGGKGRNRGHDPRYTRLVFLLETIACSSIVDPWASVSYLY